MVWNPNAEGTGGLDGWINGSGVTGDATQIPSSGTGYNDFYGDYGPGIDTSFPINESAYTGGDYSGIGTGNQDYFNNLSGSNSLAGYDSGIISGYNGDSYFGSSNPYSEMGSGGSSNAPYTGMESSGLFGSDIERLAKNPLIRTLMSLNPITAGLGALARGPKDAGGFLGSLLGGASGPLGALAGGSAGRGFGSLVSGGNPGIGDFLPSGGSLGSMFGGAMGSSLLGGQYGGMLGSFGAGQLTNMANQTGNTPGFNPNAGPSNNVDSGSFLGSLFGNGGNGDINGSVLGLLPSIYGASTAGRSYNGQINNLNQLFSPNSAYAQDMRKQLERRDAAAGRRSQYGGREVELQAKLATLAAQQAPQIQSLTNQKNANRNLLLQTALRNPGVQNLLKQGGSTLMDLFKGSSGGGSPSLGSSDAYSGFDTSSLPNLLAGTGGWVGGTGGGGEPDWGF
jgi:hypothetical protein